MSQEEYRYINVEEALQKQFESRYSKLEHYEQDPVSYELENIKKLGFGKLTLALIIAEVMTGDDEVMQRSIKKYYSDDEINHYQEFANKTIADKKAGINAHRVHKADDETYGLDMDEFENPHHQRPSISVR